VTQWLELSIHVPYEFVEPVAELFRRYGKGGVVIEEAGGFNPDNGEQAPGQSSATLRTYMPATAGFQAKREMVHIGIGIFSQIHPLPALQELELAQDEWESAWKAHFTPLRAGKRLMIIAPFHDYTPLGDDVVIQVDPGLAFGTGHHPTTRRCLDSIELLVTPGCQVVDVGSGSGILGIAAAKLGAGSVTGVETDKVALRVGRANFRANGVAGRVRSFLGSLPHPKIPPGSTDLILANISARVLADLATELCKAMKPEGWLVASGMLDEQQAQVERAFAAAGLDVREALLDDDWVTLLARRK
jgi:ribosomal protein L11 methyltransferase